MIRQRGPLSLVVLVGGLMLSLANCSGDLATAPSVPVASAIRVQDSQPQSLLYCPSARSMQTSATIGQAGGVVAVGGFSMRVPGGVLSEPTRFTLLVPASQYLEVEISAAGYKHYQFERPVMVTLDYSRCSFDLRTADFSAWYIDSDTKEPLANMGGHDDRGRHRVTFFTDHLSGYAIAN
jgi:hypothetical protein